MDIEQIVNRIVDDVLQQSVVVCSLAEGGECEDCLKCVVLYPQAVQNLLDFGATRIGSGPGVGAVGDKLNRLIDHTLLKPEATPQQIIDLCMEARTHRFAAVCVNSCYAELASQQLQGSDVLVCSVVGFPLGACTTKTKAYETQQAIEDGAREIDTVINVGKLKSGDYDYVEWDIRRVVETAGRSVPVKVILEICLLNDEEKIKACLLAKRAGATFVKTSTGFNKGGATAGDVALMRKVVGPEMGVKAAGGIRDFETASKMVAAGATRIGASASVKIVS